MAGGFVVEATVENEPVEASVDDEGLRRPTEGLPRVGILAAGELDVEAAAELTGLGQRITA